MHLTKLKNKIKKIDSPIKLFDWCLFIFFSIVCFFLFAQVDLIATGEHSLVLLKGHILDFYSTCYDLDGSYSANYMPPTFILIAVWNIPFAIFGQLPEIWGTFSFAMLVWDKLLMVLLYIASGIILYRICVDCFNFSIQKSKVAMYLFYTAPLAFFSQFIFSQYDIFTVFFMLLGMYNYFAKDDKKKNKILFFVFFGIAITFKYFVAFIFLILLLLKIKKIFSIILYSLGAAAPFLFLLGTYLIFDGDSFKKSVFQFTALKYADVSQLLIGFAAIQLLPLLLIFLFAWTYFVNPKSRDEWISYAMFFCCGVCFAVFSLMSWHPQWLIFIVPFMVISLLINKYYDVFLWLDMLFIVAFYILTVNVFVGNVDQVMLKNMILAPEFRYSWNESTVTMNGLFRYKNINMLYTVLAGSLLVNFIFKHPRYCFDDIRTELDIKPQSSAPFSTMNVIRVRFLIGVLAFMIPALICLPSMLQQSKILWQMNTQRVISTGSASLKEGTIEQEVTVSGDTIQKVLCGVGTANLTIQNSRLKLTIIDPETQNTIGVSTVNPEDIKSESMALFLFNDLKVTKGKQYIYKFSEESSERIEPISVYYLEPTVNYYSNESVLQDYTSDHLIVDNKSLDNYYLLMIIIGK